MLKPTTGERATILTSAVAAIAILGAAVTAQQSRSTPQDRLESLESDLRFQLQLTWRQNRGTFDARLKELDETLEAWKASQQTERDRELLIGWLRESIVRSLPGESGELPPAPEFGAAPTKEIVAVASAASKPTAETEPKAASAKPQAAHTPTHNAVTLPAEARAAQVRRPRILAQSKVEKDQPAAPADKKPADGVGNSATAAEQSPSAERSVTVRKPPLDPAASPASTADKKNVLDAPPVAQGDSSEITQAKPQAGQPPVAVNLAELNARIGGYHDGLDEVESAIVASRKTPTRLRVTRLVTMVEELAAQRQFVALYYEALTKAEREFVIEPRPMAATVKLVERQLEQLEATTDEDFLESDDGTAKLSRRLKKVANSVAE